MKSPSGATQRTVVPPPAAGRLLPQWHTRTGPVDEAAGKHLPQNPNAPIVIGHDADDAAYWLCGILMSLLADLYQVTGKDAYLHAARGIFDFSIGSPELGRVCAAHKFVWGAARLFGVTKDPRHLDGACRVVDWLVANQRPNGIFVYSELFGPDDEPVRHPTSAENARVLELVSAQDDKHKALNDVFWAVLNSKEFIFNH